MTRLELGALLLVAASWIGGAWWLWLETRDAEREEYRAMEQVRKRVRANVAALKKQRDARPGA